MINIFLKWLLSFLATVTFGIALFVAWLWPRSPYLPEVNPGFTTERHSSNPIIHSGLHPQLSASKSEGGYVNINGPSVIRVPEWVEKPLGKYYLYFSHHKGDHIRLAYAESPVGPWSLYEPGVLQLKDSGFPVRFGGGSDSGGLKDLWNTFSPPVIRDYLLLAYRAIVSDQKARQQRGVATAANSSPHIASPDVVIDEEGQRLIMYFHGLEGRSYQRSRIGQSSNGIDFKVLDETVFSTYLRGFEYRDEYYLLGMPGVLYRSPHADRGFSPRSRSLFEHDMRHAATWVEGDTLHVLWSRVGDVPEAILYSRIDMSSSDWGDWQATEGVEILRPAVSWEGSDLPVFPSLRGEIEESSHELRDPFVFRDTDGSVYLYYVGAGEQAIGVARIHRG